VVSLRKGRIQQTDDKRRSERSKQRRCDLKEIDGRGALAVSSVKARVVEVEVEVRQNLDKRTLTIEE